MTKFLFKILKISFYYVAVIVICTYLGGWISGEFLYNPTPEELSTQVEPKFENLAEKNRYEISLQGNLWGFGGGFVIALMLRIITDKKIYKSLKFS